VGRDLAQQSKRTVPRQTMAAGSGDSASDALPIDLIRDFLLAQSLL
jgi:hypothetical protein